MQQALLGHVYPTCVLCSRGVPLKEEDNQYIHLSVDDRALFMSIIAYKYICFHRYLEYIYVYSNFFLRNIVRIP